MIKHWEVSAGQKSLAMPTLGTNGRFGNQLRQYAKLVMLADQLGRRIETPPWVGQQIYGFTDLPISGNGTAVEGMCDYPFPHSSRSLLERVFVPVPEVLRPLEEAYQRVIKNAWVIAIHLRRGDYQPAPSTFPYLPNRVYLDWVKAMWQDGCLLYIATDEPHAAGLDDFAEFDPLTAVDMGCHFPEFPFFTDFWMMTQAEELAIAHSTFSQCAAALNAHDGNFVAPCLETGKLIPHSPWSDA